MPTEHCLLENIYSILWIKATSPRLVVTEGAETGFYLSMNEDGKLYASSLVSDESHILERMVKNARRINYNTFQL